MRMMRKNKIIKAAEKLPPLGDSWRDDAACIGEDVNMFVYASYRRGPTASERYKLDNICKNCPVMLSCRYEAIRTDSVGWWGGMDDHDRLLWAEELLFKE